MVQTPQEVFRWQVEVVRKDAAPSKSVVIFAHNNDKRKKIMFDSILGWALLAEIVLDRIYKI